MKEIVLILMLHCLTSSFSQDTTVVYLDTKWKKTNVETATYKRYLIKVSDEYFRVEDYSKNGVPEFSGQFKSEKLKNPFGEFISYDTSGTIREVYNFDESGELDKEYRVYTEDGRKDNERSYKNGKKDGFWKWYYDNNSISWFEQWRNDTLVMLQQFSTEGVEFKSLYNLNIAPKWNYDQKTISEYIKGKLKPEFQNQTIQADFLAYIGSDGKLIRFETKAKADTKLLLEIEKILVAGPIWLPALDHLRPIDGVLEIEIKL